MFKNAVQMGRWLTKDTGARLVARCQVLGLALLCMVLVYPTVLWLENPPRQRLDGGGLNTDSNIDSRTLDINDAGDVVGYLLDMSTNELIAVLWEVTGTTVTEHILAGGTRALESTNCSRLW